jgi:hypothetical protein
MGRRWALPFRSVVERRIAEHPLSIIDKLSPAAQSSAAMNACNELADYEWLVGGEAAEILADFEKASPPTAGTVERLRRHTSPRRAHMLLELQELRQRGADKFVDAARMFFTRTALEQATDQWVAAYKASRVFGQPAAATSPRIVADLCCGIGGDLLALAGLGPVAAADRDPIAALLAGANARSVLSLEAADRVEICVCDVDESALENVAVWHIDPDRRSGNGRTTSLQFSSPNADTIARMLSIVPHAAVKLAPGANVPGDLAECCELEWISRGGECKQLVAWHGALTQSPGRRRATILDTSIASEANGCKHRTLLGTADTYIPIAAQPDHYVFDVDAAVLAARLKGALAAEYNLRALASGSTYLTGATPIRDAALSCFEVIEVLPCRLPQMARYLRERRIGRLEIKKRGVAIGPHELRRDLKLSGDNEATLLVTYIAGRPAAIVANRLA